MSYTTVRAVWYGPICAEHCPHESCLVIAVPSLFRAVVRVNPPSRS